MKQLVLKSGKIRFEDVPTPKPKENEVLVKTLFSFISAGTETSSIKSSSQSLLGRALSQPQNVKKVFKMVKERGLATTYKVVRGLLDFGVPIGYSLSGEVVAVGQNIKEFSPGDKVVCAGAGKANHAEYVTVNKNLTAKIPKGVHLNEASITTIGAIALQGVRQADPKINEAVGVIGLGLIGQLAVQILKANGTKIFAFDPDQRRQKIAKDFGADFVSSKLNPKVLQIAPQGFDSIIITASTDSSELINQAMTYARKRGKVVVLGAIGLNLQRSPWYEKEIELLISTSYGPGRYDQNYEEKGLDYPYAYVRWTEKRNLQAFLELLAQKKINVAKLIEKEFFFSKAVEAYRSLNQSPKPLGVVLRYEPLKTELEDKIQLRPPIAGKINVGLIGAGAFAQTTHLPNILKLRDFYNLKAVCTTNGLEAKRLANQFNAEYAATDYLRVIYDKDINLVIIATRHNLHAKMVVEALKAGKNVFVEKPLCLNEKELNQIEETYNSLKTKPILMVGFNRRFSPAGQKLREAILNRQNPIIINARINAGYLAPEHWTQGPEGGGRIIGEACHFFDLFNFLIDSSFKKVEAQALSPKSYFISDDNVAATIKYEDGSLANLIYTALGPKELAKEHLEIFCDGIAYIIDDFKELKILGSETKGLKSFFQDKGHFEELRILAQALKNGISPMSFKEIKQATQISLKVNELTKNQ